MIPAPKFEPSSYEDLERMYDGPIANGELDLLKARQIYRKINQAEAWVIYCRRAARTAVQGHRDAVAGQFGIGSLTLDQRMDWETRTLIEVRRTYALYRRAVAARRRI